MSKLINKLKDVSIFYKLVGFALFFIVVFWGVFQFKFLPLLEDNLYSDKEDNVKQTVEVVYQIMNEFGKKADSGELTIDEAKEKAKTIIKQLTYNTDDYFWINNTEPRMIMHPVKPELDGKMLDQNKDPNGIFIFNEMVSVTKANGSGFVNYMWPKPGYEKPQPKVSFVKLYKPWGWIVGSGIYVDDVEEHIADLNSGILIFLGAVTLIAFLFAFAFGKVIAKPIEHMVSMSEKVTEGDLNVTINTKNNDEIGRLGKTLNAMIKNMRESFANINKKNLEVEKAAEEAREQKELAEQNQRYLSEQTAKLLKEMDKFASGDLTAHAEIEVQVMKSANYSTASIRL